MDSDLRDAATLLRYGLQPRLLPAGPGNAEYLRLTRAWATRPGLRQVTEQLADGLGLWLLAVDPQAGVVCCGESGGPFELSIGDFLRQARAEGQWAQRVVFAVALLASWRLCYPKSIHLDDPERVARFSQQELLAFVDGLCDRLDEAADAAGDDVEPPVDEPGLERAWRAWQRRGKAAHTPDGRRSPRTTGAIVSRALEWMVDQGLLERRSDGEGGTFVARPRLRLLVREAAGTTVYAELTRLAAPPPPPMGTEPVPT
ncbi:MAG: hypothetical protein ACRD1K_13910 [Acidimicrobiales bacterium]